MGKVIFGINMTLDGNCDHTKGNADADVHDYFTDMLRGVDVLAYGRKTYELMVPFWPDVAKEKSGDRAMDDFAAVFDAVPEMVVFSRTLRQVDGAKTRIVSMDPSAEIKRLKAEGKRVSTGGVDIPSQLIAAGLVDECHFVVHPVIAGEGTRLMSGIILAESLQLELAEQKTFANGCVAMRYVRK